MRQPLTDPRLQDHSRPSTTPIRQVSSPLHTPSTAVSLNTLRVKAESRLEKVDNDVKLYLEKFANAAEKAVATSALIVDENRALERTGQ